MHRKRASFPGPSSYLTSAQKRYGNNCERFFSSVCLLKQSGQIPTSKEGFHRLLCGKMNFWFQLNRSNECLCNNGLRNCRYPIQIVSIAPLNTLQMSYQKLLGSFHLKSEQHSLICVLLDCFTGLSLVNTDHVTSIQGYHWSD